MMIRGMYRYDINTGLGIHNSMDINNSRSRCSRIRSMGVHECIYRCRGKTQMSIFDWVIVVVLIVALVAYLKLVVNPYDFY